MVLRALRSNTRLMTVDGVQLWEMATKITRGTYSAEPAARRFEQNQNSMASKRDPNSWSSSPVSVQKRRAMTTSCRASMPSEKKTKNSKTPARSERVISVVCLCVSLCVCVARWLGFSSWHGH